MKKVFQILLMTGLITALSVSPVFAAESGGNVVREYTFETTDSNFSYTENETIEVDGKTYKAADIKYEKLSEEKRIEETKTYTGLSEKKVDEEITTEDGTVLKLEKVDYTDDSVSETRTWRNQTTAPNVPQTLQLTTDGGKTVTATRGNVTRTIGSDYTVPFTINGKFYGGENVGYYLFNGQKIPADSAPEFSGYQNVILSSLNMDGNIYRIDSGAWNGDWYTNESGEQVRNAVYTGLQKANNYSATYTASVYDAQAVYSNGVESEDTTYTVKAIVTYEVVKQGLSTLAKILIGAGAVILVGLIVAILMVIRKKRKAEDESAA